MLTCLLAASQVHGGAGRSDGTLSNVGLEMTCCEHAMAASCSGEADVVLWVCLRMLRTAFAARACISSITNLHNG